MFQLIRVGPEKKMQYNLFSSFPDFCSEIHFITLVPENVTVNYNNPNFIIWLNQKALVDPHPASQIINLLDFSVWPQERMTIVRDDAHGSTSHTIASFRSIPEAVCSTGKMQQVYFWQKWTDCWKEQIEQAGHDALPLKHSQCCMNPCSGENKTALHLCNAPV